MVLKINLASKGLESINHLFARIQKYRHTEIAIHVMGNEPLEYDSSQNDQRAFSLTIWVLRESNEHVFIDNYECLLARLEIWDTISA